MSASPLSDYQVNALDPFTFPLSESRLIEASAGTGKTFTIALLYLRLILGHGCTPMMPPQILVTTFTQAAADELRTRIRARIAAAAHAFSNEPCGVLDPHLAKLSKGYAEPQARALAVFRLTQAANWMDEAAIFTIHSWCQRMLSSHAFHSRALFEQTVLTSLAPITQAVVQDYWRIHVYAAPPPLAALAARCLDNPATLAKNLAPLLRRDGAAIWVDGAPVPRNGLDFISLIKGLHQAEQAVIDAEAQAKSAWRAGRAALIEGWTPVLAYLNKSSHGKLAVQDEGAAVWQSLDAWAGGLTPLPEEVKKFLTNPRFNQKKQPPDHPALLVFAAWPLALAARDACLGATKNTLWAHAAYWVRDRLNHVLQQQGEMGFDDILLNFAAALRGPTGAQLMLSLRAQYPVAMIDEFQDTDPLQFEIFDRVFQITQPASVDTHEQAGEGAVAPRSTVVLIG
ncbi:MAG: UvrD-helicase domain-containing protein, partial [Halothiobacillus sp.]